MDYVANGHTFAIPSQLGKPAMPSDFKTFADSMPPGRVEITTANTVTDMVGFHKSRIVYFSDGGEYHVNDSVPVGGQVCVGSYQGFVSVMGGSVEPASERLIPPNRLVVLTRVASGLWLISKGSGGVGNYFNSATGGAVTEIANYNGTGELWRVHKFTSSGTLNVLDSQQPFRVLVVGGGGSSGGWDKGAGGGGGGMLERDAQTINAGSHAVIVGGSNADSSLATVGTGSAGKSGVNGRTGNGGASGAPTTHAGGNGDAVYSAGGGGGAGGVGGATRAYEIGGVGGPGKANNITGSSIHYGGGGGGSHNLGLNPPCPGGIGGGGVTGQNGANGLGGGGGGAGLAGLGVGGSGAVIVSYQIG